jgi:hypothetical protein
MRVTGSSQKDLAQALEDAIQHGPPPSNVPRTYKVRRSWVEAGGFAGTWYKVEVKIAGADLPVGEQQ